MYSEPIEGRTPNNMLYAVQPRPTRQLLRTLSLAVCGFLFTAMGASAQEKVLRWHDNLERGVEAARKSGKPLFVVFRCVR
jgi:hypothetical protein